MSKTVKELFKGLDCTILGNDQEVVEGLAYRSDKVSSQDAFFCIVGFKSDGHSFAQDAINRGAKVLVVERKVYLADATDVVEVVVSDTRKALAHAAANFYDHPSAAFNLVGITGTNGKTTCSYLVEHIARFAGYDTGVIGTVGVRIKDEKEPSNNTTPESFDLQEIFSRMRAAQVQITSTEVSSHALDLERVWGTNFAVTAFTNLTQDHLDYHKSFDAYFEAKARLFSKDYPAKRVITIDDAYGKELLRRVSQAQESVISVGFDPSAQIHPLSVEYHLNSTRLELDVRGERHILKYPLVGKFNVSNVMLSFACALQLGIPVHTIISALECAAQVPGRLQAVQSDHAAEWSIYVDYAHTPDALIKAIQSLKNISSARTIVVFGCGGDRDASKRPLMGQAALMGDVVIVTSDNPRSEDPQDIIQDILSGMKEGMDRVHVEPDRRLAIKKACEIAQPGDLVLIAGKGHEDYQIIGDVRLDFDDTRVAQEILAEMHKNSL